MNKDCKVSIERDANGSLSVLLTGHKDDIRMLWTMLSVSVAKATKTPLPVLCAVCSAAGPAIEDLMAKERGRCPMIRCAFCDSAMMALEINGTNAHVCPLCGAVFARRHGNTYSLIADLKGAQGVKELLHSMRPHDPLHRNILSA